MPSLHSKFSKADETKKDEYLLSTVLSKYTNKKFDDKVFNNFIKSLKGSDIESNKILARTIENSLIAIDLVNIYQIRGDGSIKKFKEDIAKIVSKNKDFKLFDEIGIASAPGITSNILAKYFESTVATAKVKEILNTIIKEYPNNIYRDEDITKDRFEDFLKSPKKFNFINAGFESMLPEFKPDEMKARKDPSFTENDIKKLQEFDKLIDTLASKMEKHTNFPKFLHYITAPDYCKELSAKYNNNQDIGTKMGTESYLNTFSEEKQIELLNKTYQGLTPLEISASCHQSLKETGFNDLADNMLVMIKKGAKPTEDLWSILRNKQEYTTIRKLKDTLLQMETSAVKKDALKTEIAQLDSIISEEKEKSDKAKLENDQKMSDHAQELTIRSRTTGFTGKGFDKFQELTQKGEENKIVKSRTNTFKSKDLGLDKFQELEQKSEERKQIQQEKIVKSRTDSLLKNAKNTDDDISKLNQFKKRTISKTSPDIPQEQVDSANQIEINLSIKDSIQTVDIKKLSEQEPATPKNQDKGKSR